METLTGLSSSELLNLPDCSGLLENGKCKWLNASQCSGVEGSDCKKVSSLEKANARLRSLGEAAQERISQKILLGLPALGE